MSRLVTLLALLVLAFGVLAPLAHTEDAPATEAKPKEEKKEAEAPKATAIPVVKLLEAGAEPRKKLRYVPSPETKVEFKAITTSDIESQMGAMKMGPIKMDYLVGAAKGEGDGDLKLAVEVTSAKMEDDGSMPWAGGMKQGIEAAKGQKIDVGISSRGVYLKKAAEGEDAQKNMRAQVLSMLPPLPEEAVGVGAKWTVTVLIEANRVKQTSISTVTLTKCEGSRIELAFEEKRSAKNASMSMRGMEIMIPKLTGTGKGTAVVDLALAGTVKGSSVVDIETTMDMMGQEMTSKSKVTSTLTGAPSKVVVTGGESK